MVRGRLCWLAMRLSLGRLLRYLDLWARYLWRRSLSRLGSSGRSAPGIDAEAQEAALAQASCFPVDLANARLHRAVLVSAAEMFVTDPHGAVIGGESVAIGEVCWMPLLRTERPGLHAIRFFATLDSGERLEARGVLTVIEDRACP